jgi:hypothetical protein
VALQWQFPQLFSFARNASISVQQFISQDAYANFFTPLSAIASDQLRRLEASTATLNVDATSYDKWNYIWGSDDFTAHKAYIHLRGSSYAHPVFSWLWKSCYRGRHKFTFWLLLRDRLSTRNILRRKNRVLDDYNCPMCNSSVEETSEHLFLSCPFATWCWRFIYVSWDMSVNIFDRIVEGRRSFGKKFFRELLLIACWAI